MFTICSCFRSVYCHNILVPPVTSNCIVDVAGLLQWSKLDTSEDAQITCDVSNDNDSDALVFTVSTTKPESELIVDSIAIYVSGYLSQKLFRHHPNCMICLNQNVMDDS